MKGGRKSEELHVEDLAKARQRIIELEQVVAEHKKTEKSFQKLSAVQNEMSAQAHRLSHELQVHQIELEMQNEELHRAQKDLEASHTRYFKLYDLAPIGYLSLDKHGLILEANLTAVQMLGVEKKFVIGQPIARFIDEDDKGIHSLHLKELFDTGLPQECELRLVRKGSSQFWVYLKTIAEGEVVSGSVVCQTALIDITERKQAEEKIQDQLKELKQRNTELDHFNKLMMDRELRMVELKKEMNVLCTQTGRPLRYP